MAESGNPYADAAIEHDRKHPGDCGCSASAEMYAWDEGYARARAEIVADLEKLSKEHGEAVQELLVQGFAFDGPEIEPHRHDEITTRNLAARYRDGRDKEQAK